MLPVIGIGCKTAFQSLVEHWLGTEGLVYALYDYPGAVETCLAVMMERDEEDLLIALNTPADGFIFWEDSSTTNISPSFFKEYPMPQINQWGRMIHAEGRLLIHHACGHIRDLIPLMAHTDIDAIESFSPPPTGNIEPEEAVAMLPEHIALIGGIEPTRLLYSSMEEMERIVWDLLSTMGNRRFVLGNSDSCPPGVALEKFMLISKLVHQSSR